MSDLDITVLAGEMDITLDRYGEPEMTSGLTPAVILSLLMEDNWQNAVAERYGASRSRVPEVMRMTLRAQTRIEMISAVTEALAWMRDAGIVDEIEVRSEIASPHRLDVGIRLVRPAETLDFRYAINWDAQEVELL